MSSKTVYIIIRAMMGFAFHLSFMATAIYRIDIANLQLYQLILVGSALEVAVFFFEVPTGIVADLKSRKLSVLIGIFIIGMGFIVEILTPYFIIIMLSQVIWGLGYTFISGALHAWISDEVDNKEIEHLMLTGTQYHKLLSVLGMIAAGMIGHYSIRLAILIAALTFFFLGFFTRFMMKEHPFEKVHENKPLFQAYFGQLKSALFHVKSSKALLLMIIIMFFFGLFSEGIDRTHEVYILDTLDIRSLSALSPIWFISLMNALTSFIGYVFIILVKKYVKSNYYVIAATTFLTLMMIIGMLIFTFYPSPYIAVLGFMFFTITRETTHPLLDSIILKSTPSHVKATVLSGFGQLDAIGQLLSGALMVSVTVLTSITGMYVLTTLLLIIPFVFLPFIRLPKA